MTSNNSVTEMQNNEGKSEWDVQAKQQLGEQRLEVRVKKFHVCDVSGCSAVQLWYNQQAHG